MLCAFMANIEAQSNKYRPADFIPDFERHEQTEQDMMAFMQAMMIRQNKSKPN